MKRFILPVALAVLLVAATFGLMQVAQGQGPEDANVIQSETEGESRREIYGPSAGAMAVQPAISFIDSPSVACYQPDPVQDACYINWYYMAVDATPNYMIAMTVTLNAIGPVAKLGGFFQTSMYAPYNMFDRGFKVSCGALGAGGDPALGNAYSWTIDARDSANLRSANYGTAYCPAYTP